MGYRPPSLEEWRNPVLIERRLAAERRRLLRLLVVTSLLAAFLLGVLADRALAALGPAPVIPAAVEGAPSGGEPDQGRTGAPGADETADSSWPPEGGELGIRHMAVEDLVSGQPGPSGEGAETAGAPLIGVASWYRAPMGTGAAGPALRRALGADWRGRVVTITAGSRSIRVRLADWCGCYGTRLIDLGLDTVRALGLAPSGGLYRVTVSW